MPVLRLLRPPCPAANGFFKLGTQRGYNTIKSVELIEAYEGFHEDQLGLLLTHCPPHTPLIATMLAGYRHAAPRRAWGDDPGSWVHFDESPFPRIVVPGEASRR